jgi:hypothetical protein
VLLITAKKNLRKENGNAIIYLVDSAGVYYRIFPDKEHTQFYNSRKLLLGEHYLISDDDEGTGSIFTGSYLVKLEKVTMKL